MKTVMRIIALCLGCTILNAQQTDGLRLLTLEDCIRIAKSQSPSAQIVESSYYQQYWGYHSFQATLKPQVSFGGQLPGLERAINPITQEDGSIIFRAQSQSFSTINLGIRQVLPWTGGTLALTSSLDRIIQLGNDMDVFQWQTTPLALQFWQPLFQYNPYKWDRQSEKLDYQIAGRKYVEEMEDISIEITNNFFDLFLAEVALQTAKFNLSINDSIFTISQGRYNVGKIAENDLLQSELQLLDARSNLAKAELAYGQAAQALRIALGLPMNSTPKISEPAKIPSVEVDPQKALQEAQNNRSDVLAFESDLLEADRQIALAKSNRGFSANIIASVGFNQSAESLSDAYKDPLDQERFNITFQVPILQWGRAKADMEAARSEKKRVESDIAVREETFIKETYFQALEFQQARQQLTLAAKSDTVARKRFSVSKNRYVIGKIDITELFNAQRAKDDARQNYIETLRTFWVLYYQLRRATLYDFENDKSLIAESPQHES